MANAAWYEPPDEIEERPEHDEDCIIEHDTTDGVCWTLEDAKAHRADIEYDRLKDRDF